MTILDVLFYIFPFLKLSTRESDHNFVPTVLCGVQYVPHHTI